MATGPPIRPNGRDAMQYERLLKQRLLEPMLHETTRLLRAARSDYEIFRELIQGVRQEVLDDPTREGIREWAAERERKHKHEFEVKMRKYIGLDAVLGTSDFFGTQQVLEAFVDTNVKLIVTIKPRYLDGLSRDLGLLLYSNKPFDQQEARKLINRNYGSAGYNLRRIVRDQNNKLVGQLNQTRQQAAGIEEYKWRTVGDDRVRDTHRANNGKTFRWDSAPAATGHPGHDIQCRCYPLAVIPDVTQVAVPVKSSVPETPTYDKTIKPRPPEMGYDEVQELINDASNLQEPPGAVKAWRLNHVANRRWGGQQLDMLPEDEFNKLEGPTFWRGLSHEEYKLSYKDGNVHGNGVFMSGNYYATNETAHGFAGVEGHLHAAKFKRGARIAFAQDYHDVERDARHGIFKHGLAEEFVARGFDAVVIEENDRNYVVVLNQRAIVANEKIYNPPGKTSKQRVAYQRKRYDDYLSDGATTEIGTPRKREIWPEFERIKAESIERVDWLKNKSDEWGDWDALYSRLASKPVSQGGIRARPTTAPVPHALTAKEHAEWARTRFEELKKEYDTRQDEQAYLQQVSKDLYEKLIELAPSPFGGEDDFNEEEYNKLERRLNEVQVKLNKLKKQETSGPVQALVDEMRQRLLRPPGHEAKNLPEVTVDFAFTDETEEFKERTKRLIREAWGEYKRLVADLPPQPDGRPYRVDVKIASGHGRGKTKKATVHGDNSVTGLIKMYWSEDEGEEYFKAQFIHEITHHYEEALRLAGGGMPGLDFLKEVTKDTPTETLKKLTGRNYRDDEVARPDEFRDAYTGKIYSRRVNPNKFFEATEKLKYEPDPWDTTGNQYIGQTEVYTIGVDWLFWAEEERWLNVFHDDYWEWIYTNILGR